MTRAIIKVGPSCDQEITANQKKEIVAIRNLSDSCKAEIVDVLRRLDLDRSGSLEGREMAAAIAVNQAAIENVAAKTLSCPNVRAVTKNLNNREIDIQATVFGEMSKRDFLQYMNNYFQSPLRVQAFPNGISVGLNDVKMYGDIMATKFRDCARAI